MAWDAFNSNVPPAIASSSSSMIEGPTNLTPNRISMPNPVGSVTNAAKFFAGAAPLSSQIANKYGLTIADQAQQGASGQNPAAPNNYSMSPIMIRTTPKRIHSVIKSGLPSIGNLYKPSLPGKKGPK